MNNKQTIRRWSVAAMILAIAVIAGRTEAQAPSAEQQAKLNQIDKYIENCKQNANEYFALQLADLQAHKANEIRRFDVTSDHDLFVWTGFVGWAEYVQEVLDLTGVDLRDDPQFARTFRDFRNPDQTYIEKSDLAPRLLAIAQDRLAAEENSALSGFGAAQLQLEKERYYTLNVQLPQLREKLSNSVLNPPEKKPAGLVTGIVYAPGTSAAVVGTNIVHQDDKLGSIKVVKINADTVEFEKDGHNWTQTVGQAPASVWE